MGPVEVAAAPDRTERGTGLRAARADEPPHLVPDARMDEAVPRRDQDLLTGPGTRRLHPDVGLRRLTVGQIAARALGRRCRQPRAPAGGHPVRGAGSADPPQHHGDHRAAAGRRSSSSRPPDSSAARCTMSRPSPVEPAGLRPRAGTSQGGSPGPASATTSAGPAPGPTAQPDGESGALGGVGEHVAQQGVHARGQGIAR